MLLLASTEGPDFLSVAPVDVEDLLIEAAHRWRHLPRRWSVNALTVAQVQADGDRLTLALDALIENAVHHTDAGSQIELSARLVGDTVILAVKDEGPGIPAAEVDRIFGRFYRLDAARSREAGGFGLGLAIVKAIMEAHQGTVHVHSTVGRGSVFELRLPASLPTVSYRGQLKQPAI
jgi:signal transduction histidine kinase